MFGILRTILATYVVLLHIFGVPGLGNYSVSFFFILSGFLMTYVMHNSYGFDFKGIKLFWKNRFLRLYPIYWIIFIISIIVIATLGTIDKNSSMEMPATIKEWFSNLSILYFNIIPHRVNPRILPTSWALTNELVFYFLISIGISKTKKRTMIWILFGVLYFAGTYVMHKSPTWRYSAIPASSLTFSIGAMLFWINQSLPKFKSNLVVIVGLFVLFNLNALYLSDATFILKEASIYINYLLASFIIILLFNLKSSDYSKKIDNYIGRYSYPFYLSHDLILVVYLYFVQYRKIPGMLKLYPEAFIPYFILLLIFSFLLVQFVDIKLEIFKKQIN